MFHYADDTILLSNDASFLAALTLCMLWNGTVKPGYNEIEKSLQLFATSNLRVKTRKPAEWKEK